ncbi:helix-turn-helix domain-containing protein [Lunatibacter salilacus]|uniref:helix-turn-helix domain-containing protein n=1 Tax=Lunatibacter salilacus TaxID=2483804 RepID=UPI00131D4D63|nr:helix-turn-helix transcriptional regulator [Lunatibacter salilacus]
MSKFGKNIKKIRNVRGLTQAQLAEMIEVNRGVVSSYEEGRAEPKIETIIKTAEVFQLSIDLLLKSSVTVNQLSGFALPEIAKGKGEVQKLPENRQTVFDFLPKGTVGISCRDIEPSTYIKKAETILAAPAKAVVGKLMLIQSEGKKYLGKVTAVNANEISLDNLDRILHQPSLMLEVMGIYSPIQQISPLEERVLQLENRLDQLEVKLREI